MSALVACSCETCAAARRHQRAAGILNHIWNGLRAAFAMIKEIAHG